MIFEKEPVEIRVRPRFGWRSWLLAGIGAGLILAGVGWYFGAGSRTHAAGSVTLPAEMEKLHAEASVIREELATGEPDTDRRMRLIEALLRLERALAEAEPGGLTLRLPEITRLERELDRLLATAKLELSRVRETEYAGFLAAGDLAEAERSLREARDLQREVNRNAPEARRNLQREARLDRDYTQFVAEPLLARLETAAAGAEAALARRDWGAALDGFRTARQLQDRLNREFPRSRFSDLARVSRFDAEMAALGAAGLDQEALGALQRARRLAADGRESEAVAAFEEAAEAQRKLNAEFSRSRFVSMERLEEIEEGRQTVLAQPEWRQAAELDRQASGHLGRREVFQATGLLREAGTRLAKVRDRWARARGGDEDLRLRVGFLVSRLDLIAAIQDRCYDQLRPVSGLPGVALGHAAVTQADYAAVMSRNPSRQIDNAAPVDSVTAEDVLEYCRRLTWILGRDVRLPTAAELDAARRAGPEEFAGLNGGFNEWVGPVRAGGSLDWRSAEDGQVRDAPAGGRARDRGFRIVVAIDLLRPAD